MKKIGKLRLVGDEEISYFQSLIKESKGKSYIYHSNYIIEVISIIYDTNWLGVNVADVVMEELNN